MLIQSASACFFSALLHRVLAYIECFLIEYLLVECSPILSASSLTLLAYIECSLILCSLT
jgi:hypothetical protein